MSLKQFEKKSKETLIRFITKQLRKKSRKTLARLAYHMTKAKLPRLKTIKQKALSRRKTKRKARFRKGSPEAKRYMANLRRMRK
jgi:hypothetical protein